jgi:hypothetical protein
VGAVITVTRVSQKIGTQKLLRVEHRLWSLGDIRTRHAYQSWGFRELSLREIPYIIKRKFEINEGFSRQAMFEYRKAFACWEKNFRHVHLQCSAVFPVQDPMGKGYKILP